MVVSKSDFEIMSIMSQKNMDIKLAPSDNFKRANTGKNGFGEVVMAVDNQTILNIDKYIFGLYFINREEFNKLKAEKP